VVIFVPFVTAPVSTQLSLTLEGDLVSRLHTKFKRS